LPGVLHRLALPVVEVGRHRHHRPGDGKPEVVGGDVPDLVQDAGGDLLEVELSAGAVAYQVDPVTGAGLVPHRPAHRLDDLARPAAADEPLAAVHGVLGIELPLALRLVTDELVALLVDGEHRGHRVVATLVGDELDRAILGHDGRAGVGRSEVDADDGRLLHACRPRTLASQAAVRGGQWRTGGAG